MKQEKDNLNIIYIGRYNESENLSGPEKAAKRIFTEHSKTHKTNFIQYFFDGRKYSLWQKLFGKDKNQISGNAVIYTLGLFKVLSVLRKIRPNIIHIITFERFAAVLLLYKLFNRTKIIYNAHGIIAYEDYELKNVPFFHKLKDKICERLYINKSDKIIFMSENSIDIAEKYFKVKESKSIILANGIDDVFNIKPIGKINAPLKAVLIYRNELCRSGVNFLNKALKSIEKDFEQLELFVISNENIDIENKNVHFIKPMDTVQLVDFYRDKDVFLSLNRYDTFSISTAEAMASGLIPIVTKQTGISRYIEDGYNGFTVDYDDTKGLCEIINKVIKLNSEERKTISQSAAVIYESLSWNSVYETYYNIYSQMAK